MNIVKNCCHGRFFSSVSFSNGLSSLCNRFRLVVLHCIKLKENWEKEVLVRCMWVDDWVP